MSFMLFTPDRLIISDVITVIGAGASSSDSENNDAVELIFTFCNCSRLMENKGFSSVSACAEKCNKDDINRARDVFWVL